MLHDLAFVIHDIVRASPAGIVDAGKQFSFHVSDPLHDPLQIFDPAFPYFGIRACDIVFGIQPEAVGQLDSIVLCRLPDLVHPTLIHIQKRLCLEFQNIKSKTGHLFNMLDMICIPVLNPEIHKYSYFVHFISSFSLLASIYRLLSSL